MNRREFFKVGAITAASVALSACESAKKTSTPTANKTEAGKTTATATATPNVAKVEETRTPTATVTATPKTDAATATATATVTATPNPIAKCEVTNVKNNAESVNLPTFEKGKYQTFPRIVTTDNNQYLLQEIDLGTLGPDPDVDTIFGIDFLGNLSTGAQVVSCPESGQVLETRVVGIKRTSLETVQFQPALGGDRFDMQKASLLQGGDKNLDSIARLHAQQTARKHQKVVYVGDLGLFEEQWGKNEKEFLNKIIRAQRPGKQELGIVESNFVNPREYPGTK